MPRQKPSTEDRAEQVLAGRKVFVAGGTGNVGQYLVRSLLEHGATVIVSSRSRQRLAALCSAIGESGASRLLEIHSDIGDETGAARLRDELQAQVPLDAVVASLGRFIATPSLLGASLADLHIALNDYLIAHFLAARTLLPLVSPGGSYTFINGPLAFDPIFEGTGLVSIVTAAQAMLARVLMKENRTGRVRLNEVVLYTPFGWAEKAPAASAVSQEEVAKYIAHLTSHKGASLNAQTIHLRSRQPLEALESGRDSMKV